MQLSSCHAVICITNFYNVRQACRCRENCQESTSWTLSGFMILSYRHDQAYHGYLCKSWFLSFGLSMILKIFLIFGDLTVSLTYSNPLTSIPWKNSISLMDEKDEWKLLWSEIITHTILKRSVRHRHVGWAYDRSRFIGSYLYC